ncbi:MAG: hypothetical protein LBM25_03335 [Bacteroidales bacterium]|nr:hypothetical protein [Bacteroidales bacterium]
MFFQSTQREIMLERSLKANCMMVHCNHKSNSWNKTYTKTRLSFIISKIITKRIITLICIIT